MLLLLCALCAASLSRLCSVSEKGCLCVIGNSLHCFSAGMQLLCKRIAEEGSMAVELSMLAVVSILTERQRQNGNTALVATAVPFKGFVARLGAGCSKSNNRALKHLSVIEPLSHQKPTIQGSSV